MTILKALKKIKTLTKSELEHCIQRMDTDIEYYRVCCRNYPPDRFKRYAIPYFNKLNDQRQKFVNQLKQL